MIMFDDLDIDRAVNGAAFAAFIGAGQTCVCGARVLVQRGMYPAFLEKFKAKIEGIRVGDPADPRTQLGPVISARSRARILAMLDRAVTAGAKVLAGGQAATDAGDGFYMQATALYDVDPESEIGQEEVFGPVTVVVPFDDEADALRVANGTRFGLAASIWTNDVARAHRVASRRSCTSAFSGSTTITASTPHRPGVASSRAALAAKRASNLSTSSPSRAPSP